MLKNFYFIPGLSLILFDIVYSSTYSKSNPAPSPTSLRCFRRGNSSFPKRPGIRVARPREALVFLAYERFPSTVLSEPCGLKPLERTAQHPQHQRSSTLQPFLQNPPHRQRESCRYPSSPEASELPLLRCFPVRKKGDPENDPSIASPDQARNHRPPGPGSLNQRSTENPAAPPVQGTR